MTADVVDLVGISADLKGLRDDLVEIREDRESQQALLLHVEHELANLRSLIRDLLPGSADIYVRHQLLAAVHTVENAVCRAQ